MKLINKQILEAVDRAVKLALDDYQDGDNIEQSQYRNEFIGDEKATENLKDFYFNKVDLGLPSGTLWCKFNVGVNLHELNEPEDWYGNYYAWGEIYPKRTYTFLNYEFSKYDDDMDDESLGILTKYCTNKEYGYLGFVDGLTSLKREDMPIFVKYRRIDNRSKYSMPTYEQYEELLKYTKPKYCVNYNNIKGLNGILFTSKLNKHDIFFPFSGYKDNGPYMKSTSSPDGNYLDVVGECGMYWTLDTSEDMGSLLAWDLIINDKSQYICEDPRPIGCAVRLVYCI